MICWGSYRHQTLIHIVTGEAWRSKTYKHRAPALYDSAAGSDSNAVNELATKISKTEDKLNEVEESIKAIRTGNETAMAELGYEKADLSDLKAEKARLQGLLLQYETRLTSQQQQSGAGASMPLSGTRSRSPLHSQTRCIRRTAVSLGI